MPALPLQAVILDWSGTTADNWVIAPAYAFVTVFEAFKVPISMTEARGPMGLRKDLHIAALLKDPNVAARWKKEYGRDPDPAVDVPKMMERFNPLQLECLPKFCGLIPGTPETVNILRERYAVKIGATTGFMRPMVDILLLKAKKQGYEPDVNVAGDEVQFPRPYPYMVYANMYKLGLSDPARVLKVDDTCGGIGEGKNAKTWTCALSHTSNYMNINEIDSNGRHKLTKEEFEARGQKSREILLKSGAHYVVPNITYLPRIVEDINARIAAGETP